MITHIEIDGFKSFHQFKMDFTPLTVIAGTNAAGKSNLFDAFRLLSCIANTDKIQKAFLEQRGDMLELFTHFDDETIAETMSFAIEILVDPVVVDAWGAKEQLKYTRLRYELVLHRFVNSIGIMDIEVVNESLRTIKHDSDRWIRIIPKSTADHWRPLVKSGKRQTPYLYTERDKVIVPQDGTSGRRREIPLNHSTRTVLSSFDSVDFRHILAVKKEMISWRFLQLNPEDLRQPTSKTTGSDEISETGKNLAAALFRIKRLDPYSIREISRKLHSFIPNFVSVDVIDDFENKQYVIVLHDEDGKEYTSRVLSEGTLRILALCILWQDEKYNGLLCFEEPENGIHPFRITAMVSLLKDLTSSFVDIESPLRQVIINTHSTVFIREMSRWKIDPYLSICFAQMTTRILTYKGVKKKLFVSRIIPVPPETDNLIEFPDLDKKWSTQMLYEYLETDKEVQTQL